MTIIKFITRNNLSRNNSSINSTFSKYIYKILTTDETLNFFLDGIFKGNQKDLNDGFIHMCKNTEQVNNILIKNYYPKKSYILQFESSKVSNLKYEYSKSYDDYFPHAYAPLKFNFNKLLGMDKEDYYDLDKMNYFDLDKMNNLKNKFK